MVEYILKITLSQSLLKNLTEMLVFKQCGRLLSMDIAHIFVSCQELCVHKFSLHFSEYKIISKHMGVTFLMDMEYFLVGCGWHFHHRHISDRNKGKDEKWNIVTFGISKKWHSRLTLCYSKCLKYINLWWTSY